MSESATIKSVCPTCGGDISAMAPLHCYAIVTVYQCDVCGARWNDRELIEDGAKAASFREAHEAAIGDAQWAAIQARTVPTAPRGYAAIGNGLYVRVGKPARRR